MVTSNHLLVLLIIFLFGDYACFSYVSCYIHTATSLSTANTTDPCSNVIIKLFCCWTCCNLQTLLHTHAAQYMALQQLFMLMRLELSFWIIKWNHLITYSCTHVKQKEPHESRVNVNVLGTCYVQASRVSFNVSIVRFHKNFSLKKCGVCLECCSQKL